MLKLAVTVAVASLSMATSALAQARAFEFRGDTTTQAADLTSRSGCSTGLTRGLRQCVESRASLGGADDVFLAVGYNAANLLTTIDASYHASNYPRLLAAFTSKYGAPRITTPTWQNRAGATFNNNVATWRFRDGTLKLERYGMDLNRGQISFEAPANMPPVEAPKVDF